MPSVSELLQRQGEQLAEGHLRRGQISANKYGQLAGIASGAIQDIRQYQQQAPQREMQGLQLDSARREAAGAESSAQAENGLRQLFATSQNPTLEAIAAYVGPERAAKIREGIDALEDTRMQRFKTQQEIVAATLAGLDATPENLRSELYPHVRQHLIERKIIAPTDAPDAYDPTWWQQARGYGQDQAKPADPKVVGNALVSPTGDVLYQSPEKPEKPDKPTFGPMKRIVLSDGKRLIIRERSDGSIVDMSGKLIDDQGIDLYDKPTSGGQPRALTPNAESQLIGRLATQWNTAAKPARDLDRQVSIMDEGMKAVERGDLAQGGQAVLVTFQKILDPTSVVRESEFDRSREGLSLMQRASAAMERLSKGGAGVPLDELKKYATLAREIAAKQRDSRLSAIKERLGKNADRYNIPRELVFEDELPGGGTAASKAPSPTDVPDAVRAALKGASDGRHTLTDGSVWILRNGQITKGGG